jgi:hypothetical protein
MSKRRKPNKRPAASVVAEAGDICGNRPDLTEPAKVILADAQRMDVTQYTAQELDDLERACASVMAAIRKEMTRRDNLEIRPFSPRRKAPRLAGYRYVLVNPQVRDEILVFEPNELDGDAILELAKLVRRGWRVIVEAQTALYFPGRTIAVALTKGDGK